MAVVDIESVIKKGVERALDEPIMNGKSVMQWAEIGIHSQEQKHGHWIRPPKFLSESQCSVCKETYVGDYRTFNYCPRCGAKMDQMEAER